MIDRWTYSLLSWWIDVRQRRLVARVNRVLLLLHFPIHNRSRPWCTGFDPFQTELTG
jgi:hypothetical protein